MHWSLAWPRRATPIFSINRANVNRTLGVTVCLDFGHTWVVKEGPVLDDSGLEGRNWRRVKPKQTRPSRGSKSRCCRKTSESRSGPRPLEMRDDDHVHTRALARAFGPLALNAMAKVF